MSDRRTKFREASEDARASAAQSAPRGPRGAPGEGRRRRGHERPVRRRGGWGGGRGAAAGTKFEENIFSFGLENQGHIKM